MVGFRRWKIGSQIGRKNGPSPFTQRFAKPMLGAHLQELSLHPSQFLEVDIHQVVAMSGVIEHFVHAASGNSIVELRYVVLKRDAVGCIVFAKSAVSAHPPIAQATAADS